MSNKKIVKKERKNIKYIIFFMLFAVFIILGIRIGFTNLYVSIRKLTFDLLAPLQETISTPTKKIKEVFNSYIFLVNVKEENLKLKEEIALLKRELNQMREIKLENIKLKNILKLKEELDTPIVIANIVALDLSPFISSIIVDKGKIDGVLEGMPVVSIDGLVGHVVEVSNKYSKILLITDLNSAVAAFIQERRIPGIVKGLGNDLCSLEYVNKDNIFELGEHVVTSGTDWIYPKGILIGKIIEKKEDSKNLPFYEIIIKPAVDFKKLETVAIILKPKITKDKLD